MRFPDVALFFNGLANQLMSGDATGVAAHFGTPTPVFFDSDVLVLHNAAVTYKALHGFRGALLAKGVTRLRANTCALDLPRAGVQRAWISWRYTGPSGVLMGQARTHYVLRCPTDQSAPQIDLVEYTKIAFPTIVEGLPLAR